MGLSDLFYMDGGYVSMNYITKDPEGNISMPFRTLFAQEMIKNGVLIPWIAPSFAHGQKELDLTLQAVSDALQVYKKALYEGIDKYLVGPAVKPVFRQYN
jgi:glutamate-1-semialdehyde 2,1-aminomutase